MQIEANGRNDTGGVMDAKEIAELNMLDVPLCPHCGELWLYASDGGYTSGYEKDGFKLNCVCGYAWRTTPWCDTACEAVEKWKSAQALECGRVEYRWHKRFKKE